LRLVCAQKYAGEGELSSSLPPRILWAQVGD
jgi:hypothetical protein